MQKIFDQEFLEIMLPRRLQKWYLTRQLIMQLKQFLLLLILPVLLNGHPIPDIPVKGDFTKGGATVITVDVDPRCFADDPEKVPYLKKSFLDSRSAGQREDLILKAQRLVYKSIRIKFDPGQWFLPQFKYEFANRHGGILESPNDEITIRATWETQLKPNYQLYTLRALETTEFVILYNNTIEGEAQPDVQVLFPGEDSFELDVTRVRPRSSWITVKSFFNQGYVHVLPLGLDHILFVLGIFLLSRKWKPLLLQVTMFTLAHTITLGLATLEIVNVPIKPVEIVIAASICVVALQNIFRPVYSKSRLVIIFILGLIHGLGFASALSDLELNPTALAAGLLGFNIGVEFGQLTVLFIAWVVTLPFIHRDEYRRMIVIPVSICISIMGAYWVIERLG